MTKTSYQQLRRAVSLLGRIELLEAQLSRLLNGEATMGKTERKKRRLTAGRA